MDPSNKSPRSSFYPFSTALPTQPTRNGYSQTVLGHLSDGNTVMYSLTALKSIADSNDVAICNQGRLALSWRAILISRSDLKGLTPISTKLFAL